MVGGSQTPDGDIMARLAEDGSGRMHSSAAGDDIINEQDMRREFTPASEAKSAFEIGPAFTTREIYLVTGKPRTVQKFLARKVK